MREGGKEGGEGREGRRREGGREAGKREREGRESGGYLTTIGSGMVMWNVTTQN